MNTHKISPTRTSFGTLAQYLTSGDVIRRGGVDMIVTHVNDRGSLIKVAVENLAGAELPRLEFGYDENVTIR